MNVSSEKKSQRKLSKPLLERRRRARINACLGELRSLLLQSHLTQGCRASKLEKADILELTVRHLRSLQLRHSGEGGLFSVGYRVCVCEVRCFLSADPRTPHRPDTGGALLQEGRVTANATGGQTHTPKLRDTALSASQHHQHQHQHHQHQHQHQHHQHQHQHHQHQHQHQHQHRILSALDEPLTNGKASSSSSSLTTVWRPW